MFEKVLHNTIEGVCPISSSVFGSAPKSKNNFTSSGLIKKQAACKGVNPLLSALNLKKINK